jgi:hypothetical protein
MSKEYIRKVLRENLMGETEAPAGAASGQHRAGQIDKATEGDYERLRSILDNPIINHAGVIEQLWGSKDATKRSLFRKKLEKETNDEGGTYEFDKEEMAKLFSIIDNLKNAMSSSLTRD